MREASFYKPLKADAVQCLLCPHFCKIEDGKRGKCGVRQNKNGKLYTLVYGRLAAFAVDPIEKKPLFHFHPGKNAFSVATVGCNFSCNFCQNYTLSQAPRQSNSIQGETLSPSQIVKMAQKADCNILAYTYSEPTIAYEYWLDTMRLSKAEGLFNVFVTNGFINPGPLKALAPYLDAANIDLKGFSDGFYQKQGGRLQPVLDSIRLYYKLGIHIEITTLLIPGENDSLKELRQIANFIATIGKEVPWHISRFFPMYKLLSKPATPIESLRLAAEVGKATGLKHVHLGNV